MAWSFWSSCVPLQNAGITVMCHYLQPQWYFWYTGLSGICFLHPVLSYFCTVTIKKDKLSYASAFCLYWFRKWQPHSSDTYLWEGRRVSFWWVWKRTLKPMLTVWKPGHRKQLLLYQLDLPGWCSVATEMLREETHTHKKARGPFLPQPFSFPLMPPMGRSQ